MVDDIVENDKISEEVIIQSCVSNYKPRSVVLNNMLFFNEFVDILTKSRMYICHGGVGSILLGIQHNKIPIVVPRYKRYNENNDDHQTEIITKLADEDLIIPCLEGESLTEKIKIAEERTCDVQYQSTEKDKILNFLSSYLCEKQPQSLETQLKYAFAVPSPTFFLKGVR
jgi:UDP-N-acetylglucosamine transferase subunit ALG13